MAIKFKDIAKTIADREVGLEEVNIAQINEILSITLGILAEYKAVEVLELLEKYKD